MRQRAREIYVSVRLYPNSIHNASSVRRTSALLLPDRRPGNFAGVPLVSQYNPQPMSRSFPFVFLSAAILFAGCSKGAKDTMETPESPTYVELAEQRFGKNAEFVDNEWFVPQGELPEEISF